MAARSSVSLRAGTMVVGAGVAVGSAVGAGVVGTVNDDDDDDAHGAPDPLATTAPPPNASVISQLTSLGYDPPHVYGSKVRPW